MNMNYYSIIKAPIYTEKSTLLSEKYNQRVFEVLRSATKSQIKTAFMRVFGLGVLSVNIMRVKGSKRVFRSVKGQCKDWKKAIVTFSKDSDLEKVFGGKE